MRQPAKLFKAYLPNYRKREVTIQAATHVSLHDLNWAGGTRSEYTAYTIAGELLGDTSKAAQVHPWDNKAEGARVEIPRGAIVVRTGVFCGKESLATIYINPEDMPRSLESLS